MYKNLLLFLFFFHGPVLFGQKIPYSLCEIIGEDVYIKFNESCINSDDEACMALAEFKQYDLDRVIKSGKMTTWEKDGWTLQHLGQGSYQLHKKLIHFDRSFDLSDKFKIDISYWNYPVSERSKQGSSQIANEPARVSTNGNVTFKLKGRSSAKQVILSGSFNDWHEQELKMVRKGDDWTIKMNIPPGIYEYKFIVDGEWITDPSNPYKVQNQHYTFNSILIVGKDEQFILNGYKNAKTVALSGSFNNWDEKGVRCIKTKDGWKVIQKLPPGKHYYKFIIDGHNWIVDPTNNLQERDEDFNINSVIIIH